MSETGGYLQQGGGGSYSGPVPMTFGQILDRIFKLLKATWRPFLCIGMLPMGVMLAMEGAIFGLLFLAGAFPTGHTQPHPNVTLILTTVLPLGVLFLPLMFVASGLYYGATTYAAVQANAGVRVTAGDGFRHAWSRIGRYTWLMVLKALIVSAPFLVVMALLGVGSALIVLVSKGSADSSAGLLLIPLMVLGYIGWIVWAILMSLRLSLAYPACVEEDVTAMQAVKRSGVLTQGAKGKIFLVMLIIYAISYIGIMVVYAVAAFAVAIGAVALGGHLDHIGPVEYGGLGLAGVCLLALFLAYAALLMAAYSIGYAVFYGDQRLRLEGLPPAPLAAG